jgi:hypothetical protein
MDAGTLHDAITEVCLSYLFCWQEDDRATASFAPDAAATRRRLTPAMSLQRSRSSAWICFNRQFVRRWTDAEWHFLVRRVRRRQDAKLDVVTAEAVVNMNKKRTQNMADLVAAAF